VSDKNKMSAADNWQLYKRLLVYVKPHWPKMVFATVMAAVVSATNAASAWIVKPVMDEMLLKQNEKMLKIIPFALVAIFLIKGLGRFFQSTTMKSLGQRIIANLRSDLYKHIQNLSLSFFHKNHSANLMSRITNDISRLSDITTYVVADFFRQVFTVIGLLILIFWRDWRLSLTYLIAAPAVVYPIYTISNKLRKISKDSQIKIAHLNTILHETFAGVKIVKAFSMEDYERKKFDKENNRLYKLERKRIKNDEILSPLMETMGAVGMAFVIWFGGWSVMQGTTTPGAFMSFLAAVAMLYGPMRKLGRMNGTFQKGMAAGERVFEVFDSQPEITDKEGAKEFSGISSALEYKNLSFRYNGNEAMVLKDINLKVKAGEVIALVGLSGAGKTTMLDLIPRFYDVTEGNLLFDGVEVSDLKVASLRKQIGIVTQETILFNDTIYNNITYGSLDATEEQVVEAAKQAYAHDFISELPGQYQNTIGERGVGLSGGQKKRLTIARAFLKNPSILIFDEATSELDSESEKLVQKALENLMRGKTTFIIAHRLSTVRGADRIIVIDEGQIVEQGTHPELMEKKGIYKRLCDNQVIGAG
jgi:subfamily B ATP-binding cassette protein MsbA